MKPTLLFASQNKNKVIEIQSALADKYLIRSLGDLGYVGELEEPFDTFEANARHKAQQGYDFFHLPCFAEDAGLVVDALDGRPGVQSARYAGVQKDAQANMDKVLKELEGVQCRTAHFIAVIAFYTGQEFTLFTGKINGTILTEKKGHGGFGYDPIFQPDGYDQSFGEWSQQLKNEISHRSQAVHALVEWLMLNK